MGLLLRLFGQSLRIRFEAIIEDGRKLSGKTSIEVIGMTKEDVEEKMKEIVYIETGQRVKKLIITAATEI